MLNELRQQVWEANAMLMTEGLVRLTWGNVSAIDRDEGMFVIKPSGVAYRDLEPENLVIVDLEGRVVEGQLKPSSDMPTHLVLYQEFEKIGGITHTHSLYATMYSQAGLELPCQGTTHADHFYGTVPLVRELNPKEVEEDYETNTGRAIAECFRERNINPMEMPGCFQKFHAPFTWGKDAIDSVKNAIALEVCCQMGMGTHQLNPDQKSTPEYILEKHYQRKHGPNSYYGQK